MKQETLELLNTRIYRRFPEMKGQWPKVKSQNTGDLESNSEELFLLIYSTEIFVAGKSSIPRFVRVVADGKGKIFKITTSR